MKSKNTTLSQKQQYDALKSDADIALEEKLKTIREYLAEIKETVDRGMDVPLLEADWADVGEAGRLVSELGEIADRLNGRGEYAE